jgi:hypothetical protein
MGPRRRQLKHPAAEAAQFRIRAAIGFAVVLLSLTGLGLWYFKLQVIDHADYATRSQANRIKPRPVAVSLPDGSYGIAVHPVGHLSLSFDHRAYDGAYAAGFLARVKEILETRDWSQEQ